MKTPKDEELTLVKNKFGHNKTDRGTIHVAYEFIEIEVELESDDELEENDPFDILSKYNYTIINVFCVIYEPL